MSRHLMAKMRRTSGEIDGHDESHDDWRPMYGKRPHTPNSFKWHPPFGESHVRYSVHPHCNEWPPTENTAFTWSLRHDGMYQGAKTFYDENIGGGSITLPQYSKGSDEPIRGYATIDDAKAAAAEHFERNYSRPGADHYDINDIMRRFDGGES